MPYYFHLPTIDRYSCTCNYPMVKSKKMATKGRIRVFLDSSNHAFVYGEYEGTELASNDTTLREVMSFEVDDVENTLRFLFTHNRWIGGNEVLWTNDFYEYCRTFVVNANLVNQLINTAHEDKNTFASCD